MRFTLALISCFLVGGCVATPEVAPGESAIVGVVTARAHSEVLAKRARDEQFIPQYDRSGIVADSRAIDYGSLRDIHVGLVDPARKAGTAHDITFLSDGPKQESLAIALGDTLRIRNGTDRPLTFFLAATDSDAFQDIARIGPGATREVAVRVGGRLDLTTDEDQRLVSHLLVRRGLRSVDIASGESFAFRGLDPGTYNLVIWHWRVGKIERTVRLQPGRVSRVDEVLSVDRTVH